jgi:hypothetical protein
MDMTHQGFIERLKYLGEYCGDGKIYEEVVAERLKGL